MRTFSLLCLVAAAACGSVETPVRTAAVAPVAASPEPAAPEAREVWAGTLVLPTELRDIVVTFVRRENDWTAALDVPELGVTGLELDAVELDEATIGFELRKPIAPAATEVYSFTRVQGSGEANGTLMIGGQRFHARLVRLGEGESPRRVIARPQTPTSPYPYLEREVEIAAPEAGTLAGTLTLPKGSGPFPAVLLISGSGQQDRDETIFGHRPFRVIADRLTRDGFAVLRTDDRGVGKTRGAVGSLDTEIGDGRAAFEWLARQPEIDRTRVGIVGHSVGGIIAPTIAARIGQVAFVVSLAGPGIPGWELVAMQLEALLLASGVPAESAARLGAAQRMVSKAVVGGDTKKIRTALRAALLENSAVAGQPTPVAADLDALVESTLPQLTNPWVVTFYKADPAAVWRKVTCPVLALIGDKDLQVPADANLAAITAALKRARNRDVTARKLPGLNHLYQHAETGVIDEYGAIEETFDPATLDLMASWLAAKTQR